MKKIHTLLLCFLTYCTSIIGQVPTIFDSSVTNQKAVDSVIFKKIIDSSRGQKTIDPPPSGPKGTVTGIVIDEKTRQPVIGATVVCERNLGGTITDIDGKYELQLPAGHYTIEFRFLGYDTTYQFVIVKPKEKQEQNIELKKTEKELGIVTVTGSKYAKKYGEDVVSVEVLKPSFIESSNDVNLDQALDKVPGVTMIGQQANIRGGGGYEQGAGSRVLLLMDDLPLLTPDNNTIEFSSLPLENVEQIEVIKGASLALYGSSALDGIINVRTAWPKPDEPYDKITLFYGLYENPFSGVEKQTYWDSKRPMFGGASFSHRRKYKNLDVVIGGAYYQDKSYLADNASMRARLNMKLRYHPEKVPGLTYGIDANFAITQGGYFFLWKGWGKTVADSIRKPGYVPPDSLAYVPSLPGTSKTTPINFDPFITYYDKSGDEHSFRGRFYYVYSITTDSLNPTQESYSSLYYGEYNFHRDLKIIDVNLVAGAVGSFSNISSITFGDRKEKNGAFFMQLDKKFFDRLTISFGVRAEIISLDTLKPVARPILRSGLNYQLTESTFLRASFGQGYRYPSIAEKYVSTEQGGVTVVPNPGLQAESGWSSEIGIKQAVPVGKKWIAYFDVAGFVSQYHNMIEFDVDTTLLKEGVFAFQAQNITNARISGIDVSSIGQGKLFGYPFNFMVGYEYLIPIYLSTPPTGNNSNILQFRSRHSAKADIESIVKHFIFGVTATYLSFMENIDPAEAAVNNIADFRAANDHGTFVLDGRLGYSLSDATRVSFIAKNVLNDQYSFRPGYMEAPRNYTVQLSYQF